LILAEIIAVRTGRSGESLRETTGPIHPEAEGSTEGSGSTPASGAPA
jgi:hypothetical protein